MACNRQGAGYYKCRQARTGSTDRPQGQPEKMGDVTMKTGTKYHTLTQDVDAATAYRMIIVAMRGLWTVRRENGVWLCIGQESCLSIHADATGRRRVYWTTKIKVA